MRIERKDLEDKIKQLESNRRSFSELLEEKMDEFDYSNTTLAKKVFHQITDKETGEIRFVPVTRQAIASWLKGTIPGSREIYVSLGMAFHMSLRQINKELLEVYMGYGLYCKNIDDAVWIAVIHQLFPLDELEQVRQEIEVLVHEERIIEDTYHFSDRILTTDLWQDLEMAGTKEEFFQVIYANRSEFRDGARRFGECLTQVIEEEYGYVDKSTEFLADIGCLHCEAQFSKIKAGKAIVTREWLLRFLLSMQPSLESIEKLLAKAQMEPLGITPSEIVIEAVAREKASRLATSQEIWIAIEELCEDLGALGFAMEDELSRKYDSVYSLTWKQKCFFASLIGKKLMESRAQKEHGYIGNEYCRYQYTDKILFEELNRFKKNSSLKTFANHLEEKTKKEIEKILSETEMEAVSMGNGERDEYLLERFQEYCYMSFPEYKSIDYYVNDIYFYSGLLYSVFTGKCFVKDFNEKRAQEVYRSVPNKDSAKWLIDVFEMNLGENFLPEKMISIKEMVLGLLEESFLKTV